MVRADQPGQRRLLGRQRLPQDQWLGLRHRRHARRAEDGRERRRRQLRDAALTQAQVHPAQDAHREG